MRIYGRIAYFGADQYIVTDITTNLKLLDEDICYTDKPLADSFSLKLNGINDPDWLELNTENNEN